MPDAPPQNVTTVVLSSTEIQVLWEEVPAINRSGLIITYEVEYVPLQTFNGQISTRYINSSQLNTTLTGLQEYVEYNISVRAYTSVGPGPYSDIVVERTEEDCKSINLAHHLCNHNISLSTVPDAPPQNVTTVVLSSTEIQVLWEEVPAINRSGLIITYEVEYVPLQTFNGQISTRYINSSQLNTTLTGLQEYVEYNISVRAYTSVGPGPYSDIVVERTEEDCKSINLAHHLCNHNISLSTVPDAPPQNVTTVVLSSTEIQVLWEEVPAINRSGLIITYEVEYVPLQTFNGQISTNYTSTSQLNTTLTGLQEYVEYNISVRAYTSVGPGPYSDGVVERTLEDCKPDMHPATKANKFSLPYRSCCSSSECSNYGCVLH